MPRIIYLSIVCFVRLFSFCFSLHFSTFIPDFIKITHYCVSRHPFNVLSVMKHIQDLLHDLTRFPKSTHLYTSINKKQTYICVFFFLQHDVMRVKIEELENVGHWNMLLRSGFSFQPHFYQEHRSFQRQPV